MEQFWEAAVKHSHILVKKIIHSYLLNETYLSTACFLWSVGLDRVFCEEGQKGQIFFS